MKRRCSVPLHPLCASMACGFCAHLRLQADFSESRARPKTGFAGTTRRQLHGGGPAPTQEELKQRERRGRCVASSRPRWKKIREGPRILNVNLKPQAKSTT
ncbi:hypothetical protein T484DRAFT_2027040 [Baffinella frigidus]|nr:hypothetical protein T484DRAFT_2027040 [Cryptophyta sp. CCMP2293]